MTKPGPSESFSWPFLGHLKPWSQKKPSQRIKPELRGADAENKALAQHPYASTPLPPLPAPLSPPAAPRREFSLTASLFLGG